jgi:hypothetical protein
VGLNITSFSLLDHRFVTAATVVKLWQIVLDDWAVRHGDAQEAIFAIFDEKHSTLPLVVQSRID